MRDEPKVIGLGDLLDVVLDDRASTDYLDVDRHPPPVRRGGRTDGVVSGRTSLVPVIPQRKAPGRDVDPLAGCIDSGGSARLRQRVLLQYGFRVTPGLWVVTAMHISLWRREPDRRRGVLAALCAAVTGLTLAAAGSSARGGSFAAGAAGSGASPIVRTEGGLVRGAAVPGGGDAFLGLPYAAPPVGNLRWRPPQAPAGWRGVRDGTQFAPSCPQAPSLFAPPPLSMEQQCVMSGSALPSAGQAANASGHNETSRVVRVDDRSAAERDICRERADYRSSKQKQAPRPVGDIEGGASAARAQTCFTGANGMLALLRDGERVQPNPRRRGVSGRSSRSLRLLTRGSLMRASRSRATLCVRGDGTQAMRPASEEDDWHSWEGHEKAGEERVRDGLPHRTRRRAFLVVGLAVGRGLEQPAGAAELGSRARLYSTPRNGRRSARRPWSARHSTPESTGRSRSELHT